MSWLNPLSYSDKAFDNVFGKNGVISKTEAWIEDQNMSEDEKKEGKSRLMGAVICHTIKVMNENTERSITRRELAKMWLKVQLWLVLFCAMTAPFSNVIYERFFGIAVSTVMIIGTGAIATCFWGTHAITRNNETKQK